MKAEEYKKLEELMGKLTLELGGANICIVNGVVQDGYSIGVYDAKGNLIKKGLHATIESTVEQILNQKDNEG